jgi:hypothetical protein
MSTVPGPRADTHGNLIAREGADRCGCGAKYWEQDKCVDCGTHVRHALKPELPVTENPIIALVREDDVEHDPFGTAMSWAFAVCENLHFRAGEPVPDEMGYRPGMGATDIEEGDYAAETIAEEGYDAGTMTEAALILHHFIDECTRLGKSY